MRPAIAGNFPAHAHLVERIFDRALDRSGQFRDGIFRQVRGRIILKKAAHGFFLADVTENAEPIASSSINLTNKAFLSHPRVNLCKLVLGKEDMER
jgi:hypothetical protein